MQTSSTNVSRSSPAAATTPTMSTAGNRPMEKSRPPGVSETQGQRCRSPQPHSPTDGGSREHGSDAGPAAMRGPDVTPTDWPLRSYLELGALPSAVPCARLHAKHVLWEWQLDAFTDVVELVVSELVTNAQQASAGLTGSRYGGRWMPGVPPVRVWLNSDTERVLIEVWDGDDRLPKQQALDLEAESGRGLLLVETLCAEWGTYRPQGASGKVVWAVIAIVD
jgi:anti-sigma regulatory factor (Ser/Thr protein kinase)